MTNKLPLSDQIHNFLYKTFKIPNSMNIDITTPPNYQATLIFLHGIGVSKKMWDEIAAPFTETCQIIRVDLLGFGESATEDWLSYSLEDQANSLFLTLAKHNKILNFKPTIVVGHSMGSLIAVEFANRYAPLVQKLVLVSPPIYINSHNLKEQFLKSAYKTMLNDKKLLATAFKLGQKFFGYTSNMSPKSRHAFSKSLSTAILQQDTFSKLSLSKTDTYIIYGILDPLIVPQNFKILPTINKHISIESTIATHDLKKLLAQKVINRLKIILEK